MGPNNTLAPSQSGPGPRAINPINFKNKKVFRVRHDMLITSTFLGQRKDDPTSRGRKRVGGASQ